MSLGKRLKAEIEKKGWTIKRTSDVAGVDYDRLYSWCTDRAAQPGADSGLADVARVLGVSVSYLIYGEKTLADAQKEAFFDLASFSVPFIPLNALASLEDDNDIRSAWDGRETIPMPGKLVKGDGSNLGPNAFASELDDNALEPEAYRGDLIICDPDCQPEPGQICLAVSNGEVVARKYARGSSEGQPVAKLKPVNADYDERIVQGGDRVIGACLFRISRLGRL